MALSLSEASCLRGQVMKATRGTRTAPHAGTLVWRAERRREQTADLEARRLQLQRSNIFIQQGGVK